MTTHESALYDLAARLAGTDPSLSTSLRDILTVALQELIEAELTATIGAAPGERTPDRVAQRNGHRPKLLSTPAGDVEVTIPKLRTGSFFPELLEPRRRVDRALWAVIMTAYITGTSTRKVDDLVKALGCDSGVSKSTVPRICAGIDADVAVLRTRRLDHQAFVYVWLDATYVHVREHRHVVSKAVVIATGLRADGHREVLGLDVGDSENETFWREFLTDLTDRGLGGVKLVISDAHAGLVKAIGRCFQGAAWQRCRVHAMRNLLAAAHHRQRAMIAALIRTVFAQPDADTARLQLRAVVDQLTPYAPTVAERLEAMEADVLAYTGFPAEHWSKIWSNNPISVNRSRIARLAEVA
jgi:transposase-like protein